MISEILSVNDLKISLYIRNILRNVNVKIYRERPISPHYVLRYNRRMITILKLSLTFVGLPPRAPYEIMIEAVWYDLQLLDTSTFVAKFARIFKSIIQSQADSRRSYVFLYVDTLGEPVNQLLILHEGRTAAEKSSQKAFDFLFRKHPLLWWHILSSLVR